MGRDTWDAFCSINGMNVRVEDGKRREEGERPQLRGALGGIMMCCDGPICSEVRLGDF